MCQDFPHLFVTIVLTYLWHQVMAPQIPQPGASGSESGQTTDAASNLPPAETQL